MALIIYFLHFWSFLGIVAGFFNRPSVLSNSVRLRMNGVLDTQRELFNQYHRGAWIGKQTVHDYTDNKSDKEEIDRSSIVTGVCLEGSEQSVDHFILRPKGTEKGEVTKIASHEIETLLNANRFCSKVSVGAPMIDIKSRMLSCGVSIVGPDDKTRLKVIMIYETFDEMRVPGTSFSVPETMAVSEVIILRETKVDASLFQNHEELAFSQLPIAEVEELFSSSSATSIKDFEVDYKGGKRFEYNNNGDISSDEFRDEGTYSILDEDDIEEEFGRLSPDKLDSPDGITFDLKLVHAGGVLVEVPRTLGANERSEINISWKREDNHKVMTVAGVSFIAMQNAVPGLKRQKGGADAQFVQPQLVGITVEELNF